MTTFVVSSTPLLLPGWLDILEKLAVQPRTVRELQSSLNLGPGGTLGNRLSKMREAGLIAYKQMGRSHLYCLAPEGIGRTANQIEEIAKQLAALTEEKKPSTGEEDPG